MLFQTATSNISVFHTNIHPGASGRFYFTAEWQQKLHLDQLLRQPFWGLPRFLRLCGALTSCRSNTDYLLCLSAVPCIRPVCVTHANKFGHDTPYTCIHASVAGRAQLPEEGKQPVVAAQTFHVQRHCKHNINISANLQVALLPLASGRDQPHLCPE